ncbi:MAG: membrane protein insertase YidC [Holosporales bacterium]|jgi:YidC/Oxa1 family membrane protein insertase|nr:membrane protein insertase YidC [Holosporales bacterium]
MSLNNNNDGASNRNLIVALVIFVMMMFCYNHFFDGPQQTATQKTEDAAPEDSKGDEQSLSASPPQPAKIVSDDSVAASRSRQTIENANLIGSVNPNGGVLDIVTLKSYKQTTDDNSECVKLLSPSEFYCGIAYNDKTNNELIAESSVWIPSDDEGTDKSATLSLQTQHGLIIKRTVAIDDGYLANVTDEITNVSGNVISVSADVHLVRKNPPQGNYAVVHEGLIGSAAGRIEEVKYSNVDSEKKLNEADWFGFTDIYWLCAIINKDPNFTVSYTKSDADSFKVSAVSKEDIKLQPEETVKVQYSVFTGPKDMEILNGYGDKLRLQKFDMAIDFGWFFIVTKPLLYLMDILAKIFSNMGLVVVILTLMFKILTYPLTKKSFASMAKMKKLQPKITNLQKTYSHDKMRLNQELVALYKREQVSPMSGCLPMLLQAPIFFCLYKVFFISIHMRHAPLFLWIRDLSAPDPLYIFNLFGVIDWTPPGFLRIGVWPIIMGLTMFWQQKLSSTQGPKSPEKTSEQKMQENMMIVLPIMFTYICSSFPVGVVIYWTISNIISMIQQRYTTMRAEK